MDGNIIYFNEAEAVASLDRGDKVADKPKFKKTKGKRATDIGGLPIIPVEHMDDHDTRCCEDLLSWSDKLPAEYRK